MALRARMFMKVLLQVRTLEPKGRKIIGERGEERKSSNGDDEDADDENNNHN